MASVNSPITVVEQRTFHEDPSILPGFSSNREQIGYYGSRVMFLNRTREDVEPRVFYANTIDELSHVRDEILSKPLVWFTEARHTSTQSYVVVRVTTTYSGKFVVMLNAGHPAIAGPLTQALQQALEHILQGEKYCIELDIKNALRGWFMHKIQQDINRGDVSDTRITITNYSKYNHDFDCCNNYLWVCCLPCCLLSAPCYKIHRHRTVKDIHLDLGHLPVSHRVKHQGIIADMLPSGDIAVVGITLQGADMIELLEDASSNQTQAIVTPPQPAFPNQHPGYYPQTMANPAIVTPPQPAVPCQHPGYYAQTTENPARTHQHAEYGESQMPAGNTLTEEQFALLDPPPSYEESMGGEIRTRP